MDEVIYVGQGHGIGWVGMMDEEHEKGWGRQRTKDHPSQQQPCHCKGKFGKDTPQCVCICMYVAPLNLALTSGTMGVAIVYW